jgi:hypothetical protein
LLREPGQQGRCGCQWHQHRQQGWFADEQRDLGLPEHGGGIPLAHHGGGLFPFAKIWRANAVEQLLGRAHDKHPPMLPKPMPPGTAMKTIGERDLFRARHVSQASHRADASATG